MSWPFPPQAPTFGIDCCPVRFLSPDVQDLFMALNMAGGNLTLTEQQELPRPYVEAANLAMCEQGRRQVAEMKASTRG